jgi:single-strand DNA-binding protein
MYQRITLVGNLGNDPDLRYLPDGRPVANFSMATNRKWNNKDGSKGEETVWWRISVFGNQAEPIAQYLSKGRAVLVEGRMRPDPGTGGPRTYTKGDGTIGAQYEVTAEKVPFLPGRNDTDAAPAQTQAHDQTESNGIPF